MAIEPEARLEPEAMLGPEMESEVGQGAVCHLRGFLSSHLSEQESEWLGSSKERLEQM